MHKFHFDHYDPGVERIYFYLEASGESGTTRAYYCLMEDYPGNVKLFSCNHYPEQDLIEPDSRILVVKKEYSIDFPPELARKNDFTDRAYQFCLKEKNLIIKN